MTKNIQQFEALFNHATIGIIVTDKEGKIVNFNKYAETQFGYSERNSCKTVDILFRQKFILFITNIGKGFRNIRNPGEWAKAEIFTRKKDAPNFRWK